MAQPTITRHWNWWACIAYTLMLAALVFYFYVRIRCGSCNVTTAPPWTRNHARRPVLAQCLRDLCMTPNDTKNVNFHILAWHMKSAGRLDMI
jgi:hypothetical protein